MDLIQKADQYDKYEKAIVRRDQLRKEAWQIQREYIRAFGELIERSFKLKIDCIRYKKMISFCQAKANRGERAGEAELSAYIASEMAPYAARLRELQHIRNERGEKISEYDAMKIRRIYKAIVKEIHPDINPVLFQDEEIRELWDRVVIAYNCNDLEALEELQVLVAKVKERSGGRGIFEYFPDIEQRIEKLNAEINKILTTDPYLYRLVLDDPKAAEEKRRSLEEEIDSYTVYRDQLKKALEEVRKNGK